MGKGWQIAALPPHSAVRLCLTGLTSLSCARLCLSIRRRSLLLITPPLGKAEPYRTVRQQSRSRTPLAPFGFLPTAHCTLLTAHATAHSFVLASLRFNEHKARAGDLHKCSPFCPGGFGSFARSFPSSRCPAFLLLFFSYAFLSVAVPCVTAQQTNPVDRKVTDPMTDTPNVNPLTQDQPVAPRRQPAPSQGQASDELRVGAGTQTVSGPKEARVFVYEGNVDARIGTYRLQADKVTVYEATNKVVADGNVLFDQGEQQRITGTHAEWNYRTKTGFFLNSTGFSNQTNDGTRIYFTADRVEKISLDTIVVTNAQITACDEDVPKWSFHAKKAKIKTNDRVRVYSPNVRIKSVPIFYMPYASISLKPRDRASGFLTPTFSGSGEKGFRLSSAYYQTLGRSADVTVRNDIYTQRGIGYGADLRTRANSRSFFNAGFYTVKDRIFGHAEDATHPDQGGSSLYVEGFTISPTASSRRLMLTLLPISPIARFFPTASSRRSIRKSDRRFSSTRISTNTVSTSSRVRR